MNCHLKWGHRIALVVFAALVGALAMAAPTAGGIVGVVSMDEVYQKYEGTQTVMTRIDAFVKVRQNIFENMNKGVGLSLEDFDAYMQLVGQGLDIDKTKIEDFQTRALALQKELNDLGTKKQENKELTADETARLAALEKDATAVGDKINERGGQLQKEVQQEMTFYRSILDQLVKDGINKVAGDKKCSIVLSRDIQVGDNNKTEPLVLWGGTDITESVVTYLGKNFDKDKTKFEAKH